MNGIEITNYDVLVAPPIPGKSEEYQLDRGKNHAGNNRLDVFLNMHRTSYDSARSRADFGECENIVDNIVATVCHQCVPKGRFLVSSSNIGGSVYWVQMDEQNAKLFLHSVLRPIAPPPMQDAFEEKKRRRRSSLLRRSASESMLLSVLDSKKKLSKMKLTGTQEEPDWMSTNAGGFTLRRMDVMLTDGGQSLDPNSQSVGNNRLHVLIAMNASKYQNACIEEKDKILSEIVGTVKIWTGRFLVQGGNGYEELSKDAAMTALRNIFALRAGQAIPKRSSMPNPSIVPLPDRGESTMFPPMTHLQSRQSSESMINSGPDVNMPELETLRLAAVNNLRKKMARQKIASRLEDKSGRGSLNGRTSLNNNSQQQMSSPGGRRPMTSPSMAMKRQSSVFGISLDLMQELAAGIDDTDMNSKDPLPPTPSNEFTSKFM